MSILIQCPTCARSYTVEDRVQGKRVRCQHCGNVFTANLVPALATKAERADSLDPLAVDLSQLPQMPMPGGLATGAIPLGPRTNSFPVLSGSQGGVSNPSGGPTDTQMRLVSAGMFALGTAVLVGSLVLEATQGIVYLGIVMLMPLMFVLGIAGLISPNVVRAVGKYGGHLPWHYKAIGWSVMGLCFLLMALLMIGLLLAGFEPDRPGGRNRAPGLTRSQTASVIERIRNSYEASPYRGIVRTVQPKV